MGSVRYFTCSRWDDSLVLSRVARSATSSVILEFTWQQKTQSINQSLLKQFINYLIKILVPVSFLGWKFCCHIEDRLLTLKTTKSWQNFEQLDTSTCIILASSTALWVSVIFSESLLCLCLEREFSESFSIVTAWSFTAPSKSLSSTSIVSILLSRSLTSKRHCKGT